MKKFNAWFVKNQITKRQFFIGMGSLAVFSPLVVMGIVGAFLLEYVKAGAEIYEGTIMPWLQERLSK